MMNKSADKTSWIVSLFMMLLLVTLVTGCPSTSTRESTGQYVDDSGITASVKAALYNDPNYKFGQISVETYKNVVQLSGFVNSETAASKAVELARTVKGVKSVKNDLIVK